MKQEQNPDMVVPGLQIVPEITHKEDEVSIEVINGSLSKLGDDWVDDVGEYKKPGEGSVH